MDAMLRVMLAQAAGGGGGGTTLYDDEFNVGTVIDTAGTRYAGATPWTKFNPGTATYTVASDLLTIVAPTVTGGNIINLRWATMPLPAGDSRWRAQVTMVSTASNYRLAGMGLRRSSDGWIQVIDLAVNGSGTFASVDRGGGSTGAFAAGTSTSIPGVTALVLELERVSGGTSTVWRYSTDGGGSFTTLFTGDQFTAGAPDQIGLFANGGLASATTATFDYWRKVA